MSEKQVRKLKTRCYYTDYVNHAIRFYLSTPDTLSLEGKRKADMENWIAVQTVFHQLKQEDKQVLTEVYNAHYRLPEGVRIYCEKMCKGMNEKDKDLFEKKTWILITKVVAAIAKRRGLV